MCVIIYKPAGVELPDIDILNKAHAKNPHGCGLCSPSVHYKGLSYNSFLKSLKMCKVEEPLLIHFRFATHGSVKKSNCHPFYDAETDTYFMHNGVLSWVRKNGDRTDSECAFEWMMQPFIKRYGLFSTEFDLQVMDIRGYSRFAFMQGDKVRLFGDYTRYGLCYYSNLRFL